MYPYVEGETIVNLGFGGGFALWGVRAIASGKGSCCRLNAGFDQAFAIDNLMDAETARRSRLDRGHKNAGRFAINALKSFCYQLGNLGQRNILISDSGTMGVTADELSIVAVLAAGQAQDNEACEAHLRWLLATNETQLVCRAAQTYGGLCHHAGIEIGMRVKAPQVSLVSGSDTELKTERPNTERPNTQGPNKELALVHVS